MPFGAFALGHVLLLAAVSEQGVDGPLVVPVPRARPGRLRRAVRRAQQIGNALGVALIGIVFFGAVPHRYGHALSDSLVVLTLTAAPVALLVSLLRPSRPTARTTSTEESARVVAG